MKLGTTRARAVIAVAALAVAGGGSFFVPVASQTDPCAESAGDASKIAGTIDLPVSESREDTSTSVTVAASGLRYNDSGPPPPLGDYADIRRIDATLMTCDLSADVLPDGSSKRVEPTDADPSSGRSFEWITPSLTWNGRYAVKMTVIASNNAQRVMVRPFVIDLPASPPKNVHANATTDAVKVTWDANPEPDIVGYLVEWTKASDTTFSDKTTEKVAAQDASDPPPTSFTHKPGAGDWRYRVIALRPGTKQQGLNPSSPSSASTASVAAPTTTTAAAGAPSGGGANGSGTGTGTATGGTGTKATTAGSPSGGDTARGSSAGTVDLSSFSRLLDQRRATAAPTRRPAEPDPGFDETLPFEAQDEPAVAASAEPAAGRQEYAQEVVTDDGARRRAMTFVAASLLFAVLGYGLRLVKREAELIDLEPAAPVGDGAPATFEPTAAEPPAPETVAAPVDDHVEELPARVPPAPVPAAAASPHLDVPLPPRRARRAAAGGGDSTGARRTAHRVPQGPATDRGPSPAPVRARSRRAGGRERRAPLG